MNLEAPVDDKSSFSMSEHAGPLEAYVCMLNKLLYILFHDYRMMWAELALPVGPYPIFSHA